jgi:two-component system KDP operon response regulator KdpE
MPDPDKRSETSATVLIVEDEAEIRRFVRAALTEQGYRVFDADTQRRGLIQAGTRKPDLVVLDLGLPDGDGMDFIRDFRGWSAAPIIVLSARSDERDKVEALDAGADDFLAKPFGVDELLARVRAALRRRGHDDRDAPVVRFGEVTVDLVKRSVTKSGEWLHLTPVEFRLLATLVRSPGKVLTHRQLLREVWGPQHVDDSHYLRIYMGHLRHKLEANPAQPKHFLTETAVGYRFVGQ